MSDSVAAVFEDLENAEHARMVDAEVRLLGQPVLRKAALDVEQIDPPLVSLCHRMVFAMRQAHGLGIAAPQLGVGRRLFVWGDGLVAINPVIVDREGQRAGPESCLSMPGLTLRIERAVWVLLRAVDVDGKAYEYEAEGQEARLFQHEVDHLDGVLTIDRLTSRQQKRDATRKLAKLGLTDRRV